MHVVLTLSPLPPGNSHVGYLIEIQILLFILGINVLKYLPPV